MFIIWFGSIYGMCDSKNKNGNELWSLYLKIFEWIHECLKLSNYGIL